MAKATNKSAVLLQGNKRQEEAETTQLTVVAKERSDIEAITARIKAKLQVLHGHLKQADKVRDAIDRTKNEIMGELTYVWNNSKELLPEINFIDYLQELGVAKSYFYEWQKAAEFTREIKKPALLEEVDYKILSAVARMEPETQKEALKEIRTLNRQEIKKFAGRTFSKQDKIDKKQATKPEKRIVEIDREVSELKKRISSLLAERKKLEAKLK